VFLLYWISAEVVPIDKIDEIAPIGDSGLLYSAMFILASLALGLFLHGLQSLLKEFIYCIFGKKNDLFFDKNCMLWVEKKRALPEYFSSRYTIWGSGFVGIIISWVVLEINIEMAGHYILLIFILLFLYGLDYKKERSSVDRICKYLGKNQIKKKK